MKYIIAHDLGTSGNKATLFQTDGRLVSSCIASYNTYYPHHGYAEQNADDWWAAVCESNKRLLAETGIGAEMISGVSFSGQMMGCLIIDSTGNVLRPAIIWADTRAQTQEQSMLSTLGMEKVYEITGHRASASYAAAKLLWIRDHEPDIYRKAYKMLAAKDFIIYRLTGAMVTDYSDASGTNLFDIRARKWSDEICDALGIPLRLLPDARPSTNLAGTVTAEAAEECGLMPGTPVVIGGGDGSCACVGAGVVGEGDIYCVLGSSSWISTASSKPVFDKEMRTFNWVHLDPQLYTPCGTMQAAGLSYSWFRNAFCKNEAIQAEANKENVYDRLGRLAETKDIGAGGVLYLPYLLGERSPRWNHQARGVFAGLDMMTDTGTLARAVMEGVGFNLKVILDIIGKEYNSSLIRMIGGGAKGRTWMQILADIWQRPLEIPEYTEEATSLGAALCCCVGLGICEDFSEVHKWNQKRDIIQPDSNAEKAYGELYNIFNQAYEAMLPVYKALAEFRDRY